MLKNAYLLAKIGADTAENERNFAENLPKIGNYPTGPRVAGLAGEPVPQGEEEADGHGPLVHEPPRDLFVRLDGGSPREPDRFDYA